MARLFGLLGNRADLAGRVLSSEPDALRVRAPQTSQEVEPRGAGASPHKNLPLGWGIGFYQGGEVLMRRRPLDDRTTLEIGPIAADVRADVIVGHVRNATVGALRTENTHPFRYRQWLYAQTGTLPAFDAIRERLSESVPAFLRPSVRGETDAEVLFYVFLSFLHDAGRLNELAVEPARVRDALRSSLAVVDAMSAEVSGEPAAVNVMVSDGERIFAVHRGQSMGYRIFAGKTEAEALIGDDPMLKRKTPELSQMHFCLLASDFDDDFSMTTSGPATSSRWNVVEDRAIVTLERGSDPHIEAF